MGLAILLFFLGIMLVILEIFFPSFGVLSLSAAASFVVGVILAFQESTIAGVMFVACTLVALPIVLRIGFRTLPKTRIGKRFVLRKPPAQPTQARTSSQRSLVGKEGHCLTELRPAGAVEIDGERVDAVTEGEYIERGRPVRVVAQEGNRIVVEQVPTGAPEEPARKKPRWA